MAQRTVTTELPVKLWQFAVDASLLVEPARVEYLNRVPHPITYPSVKAGKHVWSSWHSLHKKLKPVRRHQYYTQANSQLEVMLSCEPNKSKVGLAANRKVLPDEVQALSGIV